MMTSDHKSPPREPVFINFSERGFFTSLCRPHTGRWGHGALCVRTDVGYTGVHGRSQQVVLSLGPWHSTPPAPIPLSRRVPGGQRDRNFLLHPVLCWEKRSTSCITCCWATLTYTNRCDSLTSLPAVRKWRSGFRHKYDSRVKTWGFGFSLTSSMLETAPAMTYMNMATGSILMYVPRCFLISFTLILRCRLHN